MTPTHHLAEIFEGNALSEKSNCGLDPIRVPRTHIAVGSDTHSVKLHRFACRPGLWNVTSGPDVRRLRSKVENGTGLVLRLTGLF